MTESASTRTWHGACEAGECVEVSITADEVLVRSSRSPDGPILAFTHDEWRVFCGAVRQGELSV
ncbi:DUF397 domain-containing protein [Allorhizocola rhizosphaerae]|uniref:DUF397 domain-containing protein n=1 Tax=Allorhizocola rhizosphaerae TaxID=1872709 RepID=UPI000E3CFD7C|nr:DUF397 domain-containing protein [Allorhizocola rhizosphaerae]